MITTADIKKIQEEWDAWRRRELGELERSLVVDTALFLTMIITIVSAVWFITRFDRINFVSPQTLTVLGCLILLWIGAFLWWAWLWRKYK